MLPSDTKFAIIDEVQRIPILLNEVHRLIEDKQIQFLLTGSSARKLKRNNANMLGGRAWKIELFPLVSAEIANLDLNRYLIYGGLPIVYLSNFPEKELAAYIDTYLKDEIQTEALVRNLPAFVRFLQGSALTSGQMLNFTKIASDLQVSPNTVKEFYSILEDTLIGFTINPFSQTIKRKAVSTARFYYFDLGVKNYLCGINSLPPKTKIFGQAFEHFIALELRAYLSYYNKRHELCFWNTKNNQEVDFIVGNQLAIEVKSTDRITTKHLSGLRALREEELIDSYCVVCFDKSIHEIDGVKIYCWQDFLQQLWQHKII
jgi:Predicted ATPase (AAA+ superfamily)